MATAVAVKAPDDWPDVTGGQEPEPVQAPVVSPDPPMFTVYTNGTAYSNTTGLQLVRTVSQARGVHDPAPQQWVASMLRQAGRVFLRPATSHDSHVFGGYWTKDGARMGINLRWVLESLGINILPRTCLQVPVSVGRAGGQGVCLMLDFRSAELRRLQPADAGEEEALTAAPSSGG